MKRLSWRLAISRAAPVAVGAIFALTSTSGVNAAGGDHIWSRLLGDEDSQTAWGVGSDQVGNVVVTGMFKGSVDFGGGELTSAGSGDIFVAKYDVDGSHLWSTRLGGQDADVGWDVAVDGAGNAVVAGEASQSIFVAKLDPAGDVVWSKNFGTSGTHAAYAVDVDSNGNILLTGLASGAVDFGGGALSPHDDIFLVKLDPAGGHIWSETFGDGSPQLGTGVIADDDGNVVLAGAFQGSVDFGSGALVSGGGYDVFLAKFDGAGNPAWSNGYGGQGRQTAYGVAADSFGNVIVTGVFEGSVDYGGGQLMGAGGLDIFLAQLDASGQHVWSKRFGGSFDETGFAVDVDEVDHIFASGFFNGTLDFGSGPLESVGDDGYVASFDSNGTSTWSKRLGDGAIEAYRIDAGTRGRLVVAGQLTGSADFGGGSLTGAGLEDAFVVSLHSGTSVGGVSELSSSHNPGSLSMYFHFGAMITTIVLVCAGLAARLR